MISTRNINTRTAVLATPRPCLSVTPARPVFLQSVGYVVAPTRLATAHAAATEPSPKAAGPGFAKYETLIVLKPTLSDEERDQELAR